MVASSSSLSELEAHVVARERRALLRTVVASIVPVAAAVAFLWVTLAQIGDAQRELAEARDQVVAVRQQLGATAAERDQARAELDEVEAQRESSTEAVKQLVIRSAQLENRIESQREEVAQWRERYEEEQAKAGALQERIEELEAKLGEGLQFERNVYELNWAELKGLASRFAGAGELLLRLNEHRQRGVSWGFANTPERGFISPGLAGFVLQQIGQLEPGQDPVEALRRLPWSAGPPRPGDVVVYDSGYCMFYFVDRDGTEFVVGMTPIGILALKYQFGPRLLGVWHTGLMR